MSVGTDKNGTDQEKYYELACYTLAHKDPKFIHQHVVDAFAAQTANEDSKPIGLVFGLAGLYLHLEKKYTGHEVQLMHIKMAKQRKSWPKLLLPKERGEVKIDDVLKTEPGEKRDAMIDKWCTSVWEAYKIDQEQIRNLVDEVLA